MKIVIVSDKPFEFTFNSTIYGPFEHGQIVDLPDEVALHGIKRSIVVDEEGNYIGQGVKTLDEVRGDSGALEKIIKYDCPLALSEQCNSKGFANLDDLRAHMEQVHWRVPDVEDPLGPATKDSSKKVSAAQAAKS